MSKRSMSKRSMTTASSATGPATQPRHRPRPVPSGAGKPSSGSVPGPAAFSGSGTSANQNPDPVHAETVPGTVPTRRRPSSEKESRQALKLERRERAEQAGYDVGYAKPPEANRFKKGQSGNPKGRPKGSKNFLTEFKEALEEMVEVRENGRTRQIRKQKAIVTQTVNGAAAGKIPFIKLAVALIDRLDTAGAGDDQDILSPEDLALIERVLKV